MTSLFHLIRSVVRGRSFPRLPVRAERRLCIVFRPMVNRCDGSLRGFEALVRTPSQEAIHRTDDLLAELAQAFAIQSKAVQRERYVWSGQRLERAAFEVHADTPAWAELVLGLQGVCQTYGLRCVGPEQDAPAQPSLVPLQAQYLVFGR